MLDRIYCISFDIWKIHYMFFETSYILQVVFTYVYSLMMSSGSYEK